MNLLSIQDNLKGVSDQDLARMMQSPDSTAPSYLVLSEIRRRKDMRTKAGDMPSSTVAEDLIDIPQTYSDREGIRGLRVPGYEEEQQAAEADTGAGIEAMRAGGMVMMAEGGEVNLPLPPAQVPGTAGINMQNIMQRNMELIPGIPEELLNRLREGRTNEPERRRDAQNNALIEAGLRIAASNNPRLAGAIGEGALPAVQGYTQQRAQIRQDQRADLQSEMAAAQADIQRRYMAGQLSAAEYRSAMSEAGANERTRLQLAQQAAQHGSSQGAAESRFNRELAAQREARMARGEFTPQEYEAMSPERRALAAQIRETNRPRNADTAGLAPAMTAIERRVAEAQTELANLGPRPRPGTFNSRQEEIARWDAENRRITGDLERRRRQAETLFEQLTTGGRPRQNTPGGVTSPQAAYNYVPGTGVVPIQ
jgi:hypothetical protein